MDCIVCVSIDLSVSGQKCVSWTSKPAASHKIALNEAYLTQSANQSVTLHRGLWSILADACPCFMHSLAWWCLKLKELRVSRCPACWDEATYYLFADQSTCQIFLVTICWSLLSCNTTSCVTWGILAQKRCSWQDCKWTYEKRNHLQKQPNARSWSDIVDEDLGTHVKQIHTHVCIVLLVMSQSFAVATVHLNWHVTAWRLPQETSQAIDTIFGQVSAGLPFNSLQRSFKWRCMTCNKVDVAGRGVQLYAILVFFLPVQGFWDPVQLPRTHSSDIRGHREL